MAERERAAAPPYGGVFVARTRVMGPDDLRRAITRIAHEVVEHNHGLEHVIIIGLQTGGLPFASRLAQVLREIEGTDVPTGAVISEAVELAQRYSTDESGRFVNGMLGRISEEVRGESGAAR